MSAPKHTPVPWVDGGCLRTSGGERRDVRIESGRKTIATVRYPADAALFLAAPDLAAIAQRLVDLVDSGEFRDGLPLRALAKDAAEALARGGR